MAAGWVGRPIGRIAVAVVLVASLAGCNEWLQVNGNAARTRFNPDEGSITVDNVASLKQKWSVAGEGAFSEPVISGGRLYTTYAPRGHETIDASVRSYDLAAGTLLWKRGLPAPPSPSAGTPQQTLAGGYLWIGHPYLELGECPDTLLQLDPETGEILWSEAAGRVSAVVADGTRIAYWRKPCGEPTGEVVVRDVSTLEVLWTYPVADGSTLSTPTLAGDKLVVAAAGYLHGFAVAGCGALVCEPLWQSPMSPDGSADGWLNYGPIIGSDNLVYLSAGTASGSTLEAFDVENGALEWRTDFRSDGAPSWAYMATAHGHVYLSDQSDRTRRLEAYNATGCGQAVCSPVWAGVTSGLPVAGVSIGGDVLYIGEYRSDGSQLVAFDAQTGRRTSRILFGAEQPLTAAVAGGRVAVISAQESTYRLRVFGP